MKRRNFLGVLAAAVAAPFVPKPKVQPPTVDWFGPSLPRITDGLEFHPDAFSTTLAPLKVGDTFTIRLPERYEPKRYTITEII